MSVSITVWLIFTSLFAILASIAIWARRPTRARGLAVAAFLLASPITATGLGFALGWPVPLIGGITGPAGEYMILGTKMLVGKGIYILIDNSDTEPRYYWLPWNRDTADKLQEALEEQESEGAMITVPPFEFSWEKRKPLGFRALPQPKVMPDKPPQPTPHRFEGESI